MLRVSSNDQNILKYVSIVHLMTWVANEQDSVFKLRVLHMWRVMKFQNKYDSAVFKTRNISYRISTLSNSIYCIVLKKSCVLTDSQLSAEFSSSILM